MKLFIHETLSPTAELRRAREERKNRLDEERGSGSAVCILWSRYRSSRVWTDWCLVPRKYLDASHRIFSPCKTHSSRDWSTCLRSSESIWATFDLLRSCLTCSVSSSGRIRWEKLCTGRSVQHRSAIQSRKSFERSTRNLRRWPHAERCSVSIRSHRVKLSNWNVRQGFIWTRNASTYLEMNLWTSPSQVTSVCVTSFHWYIAGSIRNQAQSQLVDQFDICKLLIDTIITSCSLEWYIKSLFRLNLQVLQHPHNLPPPLCWMVLNPQRT